MVMFRQDRLVVIAGLIGITVLAWMYLVYLALDMQDMSMEMAMPQMQTWGVVDFVLTFIMWSVMMIAMMIPSAAPMILAFSAFNQKHQQRPGSLMPLVLFTSGYLLVWGIFSAAATIMQWVLHNEALLSEMMVSTSPVLGGLLLVMAGIFQWTPLKHACLSHCRTPMGFFMTEWRDGNRGALIMGLRHGKFCVGCCWLIMALLFVAGVMNLLWIAAIAGFVLVEKLAPPGEWLSRSAGLLFVCWGVWMIASELM